VGKPDSGKHNRPEAVPRDGSKVACKVSATGWVSTALAAAAKENKNATATHRTKRNRGGELVPGWTMGWLWWLLPTGQVCQFRDGLSDDPVFHRFNRTEPVVSKSVLLDF